MAGCDHRPFSRVYFQRFQAIAHAVRADDCLDFRHFGVSHVHAARDADVKIKIARQLIAGIKTKFFNRFPSVQQPGVGTSNR